jgi:flagellar M-ring protein FliF
MLDRLAVVNRQQRDSRRAEGRIMEEEEEEMMINQAQVSFEKKLANAKEVAKQDPKLVASVIKEWVGGNEPR